MRIIDEFRKVTEKYGHAISLRELQEFSKDLEGSGYGLDAKDREFKTNENNGFFEEMKRKSSKTRNLGLNFTPAQNYMYR